ncbi:protein eyes shut homolog [Gigantopelta aegis]|uniref:protein eyes shut homolog n=1 Tax=Gigantopelta aegis TaxID=1735272 RepID=UPI001B88A9D1|nr:protein eyes shut homolog [Gigantopelta aegis]
MASIKWLLKDVVLLFLIGCVPGFVSQQLTCPQPVNSVPWQTEKPDVYVQWGFGNFTCHTVMSCFGYTHVPNDHIEPQLVPVEIQQGTKLKFIPGRIPGVDFPIQPFRVDLEGFQACNVSRGQPVIDHEENETFDVSSEFLQPGVNYFIVDLDNRPLIQCKFGLRLNVTVKRNMCKNGYVTCSGRGQCVTKKGEKHFTCSCCGQFKGDYCDTYDACLSYPCHNGSTCEHRDEEKDKFICKCRLGYKGKMCEERVGNLCELSPCMNNATCSGDMDHFTCQCLPGFTGSHCEVNVNECASRPCQNNGMCVDDVNSYRCFCVPGFYSENCENEYNECQSNPCENGGVCIDKRDTYECHCPMGFNGLNCSQKVHLCQSNPCFNQSACEDNGRTYRCRCRAGFMGSHCEVNINECQSRPCLHDATCRDLINGYQCLCREMHAGPNCQYTLDMFAPFLEGKPQTLAEQKYHVRNLYIVAGTLSGAILMVVVVLSGCYCRMHETYKRFSFKRLKYRRQNNEICETNRNVSSVACPRLSIDAIWEATSLSYDTNQLNSPLHQQSLKPQKI